MTDNIIPRSEAIDRMKAGLPCETYSLGKNDWRPTEWADFDSRADPMFRKPPEPRRVARFWPKVTAIRTEGEWYEFPDKPADVSEVLPDDVTLQRMTEAEAWDIACKRAPDLGFMSPRYGVIAFARALGLIGEGS